MRYFLLLVLTCFTLSAQAQILNHAHDFTRQDTLRGTLGPERNWFDVKHYDLNLKLDTENRSIAGYNDIKFEVLENYDVMQLDLFEEFEITKIFLETAELTYKREGKAIFITMPKDLKKGEEYSIKVWYEGAPIVAKKAPWDGGFVWEKDSNGKDWVGVACQGVGASLWWPNKDHQSDEPDRGIRFTCAVPSDLKFVSNGDLEKTEEEEGGYTRYYWTVDYPINNYNVSLNVGDYEHFSDVFINEEGGELRLDYYVLAENLEKAKKHFEQTKPMLKCYEQYLGPYPFYEDGFSLIETPYLGMEHQSGIAYGNEYKEGYAGNKAYTGGHDFDYIIIHEAGHEWWGNSVSAADNADLWIHEAFCTYSEAIYVECLHGYDAGSDYVNKGKRYVQNKASIQGALYGVNMEGSGDMYAKGSLFLNTMRHVIADDDLWWSIIYGIANDFKLQEIDADDIINYINEKSGQDLTTIFDQYVKHAAIPKLEYKTKKKGRNTILSYRWVTDVEDFKMPVQYKLGMKGRWNTVPATNDWTAVKLLKTKVDAVSFNSVQFYVDVEKVAE